MTSQLRQPDDLVLYVMGGCGYCDDVQRAARRLGVSLATRDVRSDARHGQTLLRARGRATVPVLYIAAPGEPERFMGESQDIIRYLVARFGSSPGRPRAPWKRGADATLLGVLLVLLLLSGLIGLRLFVGAFVVHFGLLAS